MLVGRHGPNEGEVEDEGRGRRGWAVTKGLLPRFDEWLENLTCFERGQPSCLGQKSLGKEVGGAGGGPLAEEGPEEG